MCCLYALQYAILSRTYKVHEFMVHESFLLLVALSWKGSAPESECGTVENRHTLKFFISNEKEREDEEGKVSTMAFEKILMANHTSVIAYEILSHRLGLIPLKADSRLIEYLLENDVPNERTTIVFKLHVACEKGGTHRIVKSEQLKWLPNGSELNMPSLIRTTTPKRYTSFNSSQASLLEISKNPPGMKHDDIIIAKLGPGQEIKLEAHAVKGIGKTHAMWSPVATAWYRMLPDIVLLKEIKGEDAEKLVAKCPVKVFDIEDIRKGTHCGLNVHGSKATIFKKILVSSRPPPKSPDDRRYSPFLTSRTRSF